MLEPMRPSIWGYISRQVFWIVPDRGHFTDRVTGKKRAIGIDPGLTKHLLDLSYFINVGSLHGYHLDLYPFIPS